ncbi:MAG: hypothetical protein U9M97_04110, partial [Candidatus Hadarchaeota archaeon]|nr:hypothetical protein [Candidatus Hadarchaeota archaeon]
VDVLKRLSDYLSKRGHAEFSMDNLEAKIDWIGHPLSNGITNPKLPFRIDTPNAVRVIAAMFNDGYIGKSGARGHGAMHYYNENPVLRSRIISSAVYAFGGDKESYPVREHRGNHHILFPSVVRDLMKKIGVPAGSKVNHNSHVPSLIYVSKRPDLWREWLRQTADDEGGMRFRHKIKSRHIYWRRCISFKPKILVKIKKRKSFLELNNELKETFVHRMPNLLKEEKELLDRLGAKCEVHPMALYKIKTGEYRATWELYIGGKENLEKFHQTVGFAHPQKSRLLLEALRSYK